MSIQEIPGCNQLSHTCRSLTQADLTSQLPEFPLPTAINPIHHHSTQHSPWTPNMNSAHYITEWLSHFARRLECGSIEFSRGRLVYALGGLLPVPMTQPSEWCNSSRRRRRSRVQKKSSTTSKQAVVDLIRFPIRSVLTSSRVRLGNSFNLLRFCAVTSSQPPSPRDQPRNSIREFKSVLNLIESEAEPEKKKDLAAVVSAASKEANRASGVKGGERNARWVFERFKIDISRQFFLFFGCASRRRDPQPAKAEEGERKEEGEPLIETFSFLLSLASLSAKCRASTIITLHTQWKVKFPSTRRNSVCGRERLDWRWRGSSQRQTSGKWIKNARRPLEDPRLN